MSLQRLRTGIYLSLCLILTSTPWAQQPTPDELTNPAVRVTTRLVLVDVIITDKSGQRVKGLGKDDFTILENGKPQKLSTFVAEERGFEASSKAAPALPEHIYTNRPEYSMPSGPITIILLDGLNTPIADQGYARSQMLKYLGTQLKPGQPVAVYTLANSLRLLQDFTDDVALLKAAAEQFTPQKSVEMQLEDVQKVLPNLKAMGDSSVRGGGPGANGARLVLLRMSEFLSEQAKFAIEIRAERTMAALKLLSRRVAGYPGRKNLIWVSAGFPLDITSQIVQMTTDVDALAQANTAAAPQVRVEKSFEGQLHQLAAELTDAQMSVYSVDARGVIGSTLADASSQGTNAVGLLQTGAEFGAQVARSSTSTDSTQNTLLTLASESGGLTFKNRNDITTALASSVADGSSYYLLGYYPESKQWDGKFRKIQVKVNRPGVEVRHRMGYYASDPTLWAKAKDKGETELNAAMSLGAPTQTMVIFDSRVVPPPPSSKMTVPVEFLVNPRTVSGEEMKDGGRHFVLEFHVAAYSDEGKLVTHKDTRMDAPIKPDRLQAYLQQGIPFKADLDLGPGQYHLRLAVRDNRTGYIGATEVPLVLAGK
jgi:VWFA-related protein